MTYTYDENIARLERITFTFLSPLYHLPIHLHAMNSKLALPQEMQVLVVGIDNLCNMTTNLMQRQGPCIKFKQCCLL